MVLWADLVVLVADTVRLWWRLLPQLLSIYLLGWLGSELSLRLATIVGDVSAWLALVLFAFNFVCTLTALVLMLSVAGRELGIRSLLPADEMEQDDRDSSLSQLLIVTLLPFLGMYAAFGQVTEVANRLLTAQLFRYGVITDQKTVNGVLFDLATNHLWTLVGLVVGIYVLRRIVDYLHERTGWRSLGLLVVLIESFFLLTLILGGIRVFQTFTLWLRAREVTAWLVALKNAAARALAVFEIDLPAILVTLGQVFSEQVWPVFTDVLSQPLLWLAVAALVYGSRVLSLAELWRKGQPYASRLGRTGVFARFRDRRAARRIGPPPQGVRLLAGQAQEAFFGDLSDKYLPTIHSLRLVLRAGVVFLGSYVLVYTTITIAHNYWIALVHRLAGGHDGSFWVTWEPLFELIEDTPFEALRICLLAVAFWRCLALFRERAASSADQPGEPESRTQPVAVPR